MCAARLSVPVFGGDFPDRTAKAYAASLPKSPLPSPPTHTPTPQALSFVHMQSRVMLTNCPVRAHKQTLRSACLQLNCAGSDKIAAAGITRPHEGIRMTQGAQDKSRMPARPPKARRSGLVEYATGGCAVCPVSPPLFPRSVCPSVCKSADIPIAEPTHTHANPASVDLCAHAK